MVSTEGAQRLGGRLGILLLIVAETQDKGGFSRIDPWFHQLLREGLAILIRIGTIFICK